ncbi:MAG: tRNA uridine-5-carboxymethylaminomethyl(34) synthesis GTPase MnmE, partial [Clostridia bacterium]|nr:tRNA uridine-5-carboxymethylaminomethyl(34) synthesis GTPase MnmE [Clostridia bacterium]
MAEQLISAISTPAGVGGVAIVRVSGQGALGLAEKMFSPSGKTAVKDFTPNYMYTGKILCDGFSDYGMCVYFKAPKSYTGEDVVEFHCHGGTEIARGVLKATLNAGARIAERGEFTKRAFINGKLSLSSAEGVIDMINAES